MAGDQIERMRWLVSGLLKLAQVESGMYDFDFKTQSINETVSKSIDALKIKLDEKNIKVKIYQNSQMDGDILLCHDTDWMQEVYSNL